VYALGAPKGYALTFSEGIISALRPASAVIDSKSRRLAAQQMIQTTAAISLGSSGGGLFDADGRLIGITTLQDISGQNLNFAMPVESLSALPQTSHGRTIDEPQHQTEKKLGTSLRGEGPMTAADYRAMTDYLRRITARMSVQDWNGVVKLASAATQSYPSMPIFWIDLGLGYAELDDRARSRSAYEEARRQAVDQSQHYPDDFTVWVDLAQAHRGLGDLPLAIAAYLKALQRQPNDLWSWYDMGALHARLHHRPDVIRVYERLRSLDRDVAQDFFVRFVVQE
jgi:tetratricopeptide (TPR) repeat protein